MAHTAEQSEQLTAMAVWQQQEFAAFFGIRSLRVKGKPWEKWALAVDVEPCQQYLFDLFSTCQKRTSTTKTKLKLKPKPKPKLSHNLDTHSRPTRVSMPSAKLISMVAEGAEKRQLKQQQVAVGPPVLVVPEEEYEVESLQAKRSKGGKCQYLVKWVGWDSPTWEPSEHVNDLCIAEFSTEQSYKKQRLT